MYEKNMQLPMLLDCYGELLTERQRELMDLYYNEDLSLAEIAENTGLTRQGVRDGVKKAETLLSDYEKALGLAKASEERQKTLSELTDRLKEICGGEVPADVEALLKRLAE